MKLGTKGSVMVEGVFILFMLALICFQVARLGRTALQEQAAKHRVEFAAWAYETGDSVSLPGVERRSEFLGTRAIIRHDHGAHRSVHVDLGRGL